MLKYTSEPAQSSETNGAPGTCGHLFLLCVSHHHAPVEIREKLAFDAEQRENLLTDLGELTTEAVGITTCNRTELYLVLPQADQRTFNAVLNTVAEHAGIAGTELSNAARIESDDAVVQHLFRVASGLDSVILGEPQILGQVRDAIQEAHEQKTAGPLLERLFQRALATGKRARSKTGISRGAGSISHAAVQLARDTMGDLTGKRALTIGVGEMGCLVARNLVAHGVGQLAICNRTRTRAEEVAQQMSAEVIPWDELDSAVAEADIIITATASDSYVVGIDQLNRNNGHSREILVIDIAVPRNVDPAVDQLPHVRLYGVDDLQAVRLSGMKSREREIPKVERIIEKETCCFIEWLRGRQFAPLIHDLYDHASSIQEHELQKALRDLGHLSERDKEVVRALAHGITQKMLHTPVSRLKAADEHDRKADLLGDLFGLNHNR